jgi:hypothetical protein
MTSQEGQEEESEQESQDSESNLTVLISSHLHGSELIAALGLAITCLAAEQARAPARLPGDSITAVIPWDLIGRRENKPDEDPRILRVVNRLPGKPCARCHGSGKEPKAP